MTFPRRPLAVALLALAAGAVPVASVTAQVPTLVPATSAPTALTYADLAALADSAPLVVRARLRKLVRVEDARMRPAAPGTARFYIQAETRALITGGSPIGQAFAYLVDLPVTAKGKPLARKKDEVILFARTVPSRPGELQLVRPGAQIAWSEATEARLRTIITALLAPDAPARVTGVREMIHVPGTLAGEGETQIFLNTADNSAASITVRRQPGRPPQWGASFSELVAELGSPPERDTLQWYRLACALPASPPPEANMSEGETSRAMAEADYRFVLDALGPCRRAS
ncbi:hypothetical protein HNO88_001119 [Novosphingobium chloroacetimidivorans]|uniref:Uncharacterized protein n=1 Tax=Novosphingobium chloroacetimidivorans TaxID=1428314 RepID=A0A7W7K941_9SPHN|nr:hypothetical protein [Novosphingobium chloroacetimidivorans]MBB4857808.1 hypothetical protein [Novosphingobium chloroacetimidivorans]